MIAKLSHESEVLKIRKFLPIFLPTAALITAVCVFSIIPDMADTYHDIASRSPVIRIAIGYLLVLPLLPLVLATSAALVMKAVSINGLVLNFLVKIINCLVIISALFLIVAIPVGKYYESYYLESIGYSKCNQLRGQPTMWFNDWIRNPELCVRGKNRAWVLEQAQKQTVKK